MYTAFKSILTICLICLISSTALAQDSGDHFYDNNELHEVRFYFKQSNFWDIMTDNYENSTEFVPVPYLMGSVTIDGETIDSVGVRFKGFTSYTPENKKPIKIDFNEFVPGKRYDGLRKINLNNATGDPGMQRDVVCYDIMRRMGVKAPRTSFSKVYFNDEYWGLYQNVEQVDKEFLQNNFTNDDGNLYKNKGWSHFEWNGFNHEEYHPPFELKTNKDNPDWSGFVDLMQKMNFAQNDIFAKELSQQFNIDLFLRVLAVDVATNNWDSYLEHGRNWYMYEDFATDLFHWIPWDYNFALGSNFFGGPGPDECFLWSDFITLTNGSNKVEFKFTGFASGSPTYTWNFGDGNSSNDIDAVHTYDQPGVYNVCLLVYETDDCQESFCETINTNVNMGDCTVIQNGSCPHPVDLVFAQVITWDPNCCEIWGVDCEDLHEILSDQNTGGFGSSDFLIDQSDNNGVLINRLMNTPETKNQYLVRMCELVQNVMLEDTLFSLIEHNEQLIDAAVQQDPNFLYDYNAFKTNISSFDPGQGIKGYLSQRIMNLRMEIDSIYDCPAEEGIVNAKDVVINEFVASNDSLSGISDMAGQNDDWVELYNTTNSTLNLSGIQLTDDPARLDKWVFPYGTYLLPNSYLILWCDQDSAQFGLHADFKLAKTGGAIILSTPDGTIIDEVEYDEQTTNIAAARIPNGTGDFVFQPATHGFNNEDSSNTKEPQTINASVFPNPASDLIQIEFENDLTRASAQLFTADGKLAILNIVNGNTHQLDVSQLKNGMYVLMITDQNEGILKKKIIVMH